MINKGEVLVVVPAFNEEVTIDSVIRDLQKCGYPFVVIDDGSVDNTAVIAGKSGARVISLPLHTGVGGALRCGFRYACELGFKAVIQCDADGQHSSFYFDDLVETVNRTGADMVIGSRFKSSQSTMTLSPARRLVMWVLARIAGQATKHPITDATSGFRIITQPLLKEFARSFPVYYLGDTFEAIVVAGRANYKVEEIGVGMTPRSAGTSSVTNTRAVMLIAKALVTTALGLHFRIKRRS